MKDTSKMGMTVDAQLERNTDMLESLGLANYYHVQCFDGSGALKWEETIKNLVTTEGLNYIMNAGFKGGTQVSTWYVGLKETGAAAAGDTALTLGVSPTAWTEYTQYDEATRQTLSLGTVSGGSVSNGTAASFTIASPADSVYGVFVVDDNTKGGQSPATVLYGVGDFSGGAKVVDPDDTLNVTVTLSATSS